MFAKFAPLVAALFLAGCSSSSDGGADSTKPPEKLCFEGESCCSRNQITNADVKCVSRFSYICPITTTDPDRVGKCTRTLASGTAKDEFCCSLP